MTETRERLTPEDRAARQRLLLTVGTFLYGSHWQQALSDRLAKLGTVEGGVPRVRLNQWANGSKPLPAWMLPVLRTVAREGAAELRQRAKTFDAIAKGGDALPGPVEPEPDREAPQESEPPAAEACAPASELSIDPSPPADVGDDDEFDLDAFVQAYGHVRLSQPDPEPDPVPAPPEGWRSRFAEEHNASWRGVIMK